MTALLLTLAIPFVASAQISNWTAHAGTWSFDSMGDIRQTTQDPAISPGFWGTPANILQRKDLILSDFSIAASMGTETGSKVGWNAVGFAFRIQDTQNFYRVHFFPGYPGGALRFEKHVNGSVFVQPDTNVGYTPQVGVFYRLRLEVSGSTFTARLSDPSGISPDFTLTYTDTTFASGGVGLSNDIGTGFFRNVYLEQNVCGP
jgi:hypothetical protein